MRRSTMATAVVLVGMFTATGAMLHGQDMGGQSQQDQAQQDQAQQDQAQGEHHGHGEFAGMQRVAGEVTAVAGSALTVKTEDGATMRIVTTDNTRVMKGRGVTVKISDLKVGDGVMAAGNLDEQNKTLHAAIVFATDAAQVKALRENLGKTYIAGRVTAIDMDNAKMTVERPDRVSQTIGFDETTSFRRAGHGARGGGDAFGGGGSAADAAPPEGTPEGESITLADVKVGDTVRGRGSVKGGIFVPTELVVGSRGQGGHWHNGQGAAGTGAAPAQVPQ